MDSPSANHLCPGLVRLIYGPSFPLGNRCFGDWLRECLTSLYRVCNMWAKWKVYKTGAHWEALFDRSLINCGPKWTSILPCHHRSMYLALDCVRPAPVAVSIVEVGVANALKQYRTPGWMQADVPTSNEGQTLRGYWVTSRDNLGSSSTDVASRGPRAGGVDGWWNYSGVEWCKGLDGNTDQDDHAFMADSHVCQWCLLWYVW